MAEFPAMPLWTDAYLADTRHLSAEEHGAYLLLLMESWRRPKCSLPDNEDVLARLACVTVDRWREIKPSVMAFWEYDGRTKEWHQKRQRKERSFLLSQRAMQRDKALKRWNGTKKSDAAAMPEGMPNECREICRNDAPTPTPIDSSLRSESSDSSLRSLSASPSNPAPIASVESTAPHDPIKAIFDGGVELFAPSDPSKQDIARAKAFTGKLRKQFGDGAVLHALAQARVETPSDPMAFVVGCLKASQTKSRDGPTESRYRRTARKVLSHFDDDQRNNLNGRSYNDDSKPADDFEGFAWGDAALPPNSRR